MSKKFCLTLAWTLVLVGVLIALFFICANFESLASISLKDKQYGEVFKYIFRVKGYALINLSLIGGYIIKLVEIWSNKDGK